ncbi:MAG TPA: DnaJ domain-containing protein [Candidatus Omnitrophota bacterium]|nr:DnaJ domain-containing protein [Candidatus Omnitrophota bacterium]
MTTLSQDPKGYYAVLGLAPGATFGAIKAAYRNRVKSVHPDRNRQAGAAEEFQRLVEAYTILKDVVRRAEYDAGIRHGVPEDDPSAPAIPLACGSCGKVTAQPRYVLFHRVKSFLLWARSQPVEGIFCRDCADHAAVRASTATWAWGWWSPPGLVLTPLALLRNLLGGTMPKRDNARLLLRQARAFVERGDLDIARSLADQAARFARDPAHRKMVEDLRIRTQGASGRKLKSRWGIGGGAFVAQALPLLALPAVVALFVLIWTKPWNQPVTAGPANIVVKPALIGEIRHVAVGELKVRQDPAENSPVLTLLDRFTTVTVEAAPEDGQWTRVKTPAGVAGWVPSRALYAGSGGRIKTEWCAENRGGRPESGEVLSRRASGDHRLLIRNDGRRDAVVKLKTQAGSTVASYFVPATYHVGIAGIPEGTYLIEFASGSNWSRACGLFVDNMQTARLPFTLTFRPLSAARAATVGAMPEITLVTAPGDVKAPQPITAERFLADE